MQLVDLGNTRILTDYAQKSSRTLTQTCEGVTYLNVGTLMSGTEDNPKPPSTFVRLEQKLLELCMTIISGGSQIDRQTSAYVLAFQVVLIRPNSFADVSTPDWIRGGTISHVINNHVPTMTTLSDNGHISTCHMLY
jgi:hypothetical protein